MPWAAWAPGCGAACTGTRGARAARSRAPRGRGRGRARPWSRPRRRRAAGFDGGRGWGGVGGKGLGAGPAGGACAAAVGQLRRYLAQRIVGPPQLRGGAAAPAAPPRRGAARFWRISARAPPHLRVGVGGGRARVLYPLDLDARVVIHLRDALLRERLHVFKRKRQRRCGAAAFRAARCAARAGRSGGRGAVAARTHGSHELSFTIGYVFDAVGCLCCRCCWGLARVCACGAPVRCPRLAGFLLASSIFFRVCRASGRHGC